MGHIGVFDLKKEPEKHCIKMMGFIGGCPGWWEEEETCISEKQS
jgi:hypothetical protein